MYVSVCVCICVCVCVCVNITRVQFLQSSSLDDLDVSDHHWALAEAVPRALDRYVLRQLPATASHCKQECTVP